MKRYIRLEQTDIEFAIAQELKRIGSKIKSGRSSWKLIKADHEGEKDAIAFECEVENYNDEPDEEDPRQTTSTGESGNKKPDQPKFTDSKSKSRNP
jgi:hypothetical protein